MNPTDIGWIGLFFLVLLIFAKIPIGFVMAIVGFVGLAILTGWEGACSVIRTLPFNTIGNYSMCVIPMFVLMGELASSSGLTTDLYRSLYTWIGALPGGLAMASVAGCAGFAAVSGSSIATAVTMGTIALPEMRKYKYDDSLATGCIAAGGTLGILIPPSIAFVLYGVMTTQSIGKLLLAGFLPGFILASVFMLIIYIRCRLNESLGPPGPASSLKDKLTAFKGLWSVLFLFILVIGGMYVGIFTPTEGAGVGAFAALILVLARRRFNWQMFMGSLKSTMQVAVMCIIIITGGMILGRFLAVSRIPYELTTFASGLQVHPIFILLTILVVYTFLGCIMDMFAVIVITVPIVYPLIVSLGFDPIWFGVIVVIMGELGLITPPVGLNVYVISAVAKVPMYTVFRGITPFIIGMWIVVFLLIAFPQIALFIPTLMK